MRGVEGANRRRKVGRNTDARHVRAAGGVHGNAESEVTTAAAEESGVDERRAGRVELRDESVLIAVVRGVEGADSRREVGRNQLLIRLSHMHSLRRPRLYPALGRFELPPRKVE